MKLRERERFSATGGSGGRVQVKSQGGWTMGHRRSTDRGVRPQSSNNPSGERRIDMAEFL